MIKKIVSYLVVLLVLLEYTSATASAFYKSNKVEPPRILSKYEKRRSAIFAVCKDEYITDIIANSKYPYTLTAIAKVESDFRPNIRGDHGKSYGLYQIQERHWGYVPRTIEGQTRVAERIVGSLVDEHGYSRAIERYNGSGKDAKRYRHKVLLVINQLEKIERSI